ncbi:MAG: helix-turn-helix domain-containing protein [Clostridiales bacterium]|nr:helix-turn-helix domain-containing protein [Clostridiales bacterium]
MNRLKELRREKKLKQVDVATVIGMSMQALSNYENGLREPDFTTLNKLAEYFGVSVDYLLGRTDARHTTNSGIYDIPSLSPIGRRRVPMLGKVACGEPIYADEDRESYVMAGTDINADFCLTAQGDSMIGARIMDGDIVFCRQQDMVENGEIAVVLIGDEATLKRVYYYPENKMLVLRPENPKYKEFVYKNDELNEIRILGKAVAFQSDVR